MLRTGVPVGNAFLTHDILIHGRGQDVVRAHDLELCIIPSTPITPRRRGLIINACKGYCEAASTQRGATVFETLIQVLLLSFSQCNSCRTSEQW
jgi:hypothetical protein